MVGNHVIKTWSATQVSLALSSGEAEYYGVVRASGVGLGQQALFRDAGLKLNLRVWTDSSAAIGTASRQGLGKLRHVECHSLWLQQRLRRKEFELRKIAGEENPADLFTKHLESAAKLKQLIGLFNCEFAAGRAKSAPSLKRAATADGKPTASDSEQAVHLTQLPHLMTSQAIEDNFPRVQPVSEDYGEEDVPVEEELGDPVPRLTRTATGSTRTPAGRAGGKERDDSRDRAYIVADAGCLGDVSGHEQRGAAPVGRCLGRHSLTYDSEQPRPSGHRRQHPRLWPSCRLWPSPEVPEAMAWHDGEHTSTGMPDRLWPSCRLWPSPLFRA